MTGIEERPSLAERYSAAVESSNLRVKEVRGDADYLIAAGWGGTGIGPRLIRLRKEFDVIKGARDLANRSLAGVWPVELAKLDALVVIERAYLDLGPTRLAKYERLAGALRIEIANYAASEAAFVLVDLGDNLAHVKAHLGELAVIEATKTRFMEPDKQAAYIAGRCLAAWLDPNCLKCDGRGFTGGGRHEMSGPPIKCRACRETGKRIGAIPHNDEQARFASHILALMEHTVSETEAGMSRALRT